MALENKDLHTTDRTPDELLERESAPTDMPARAHEDMTPEELAQQESAELPDREAMSLINANVAAPINAAIAANVLSDNSTAQAIAIQDAPITQHN
jgi:hypothetical protein